MNNPDYRVKVAHIKGGIRYEASEQSVLKADGLKAGKMGKHKDLSNVNKSQIVMARRLCISKILWGSHYVMVSTYPKWSKKG